MIRLHSKIKEFAYSIWEFEGKPLGKEREHYQAAQCLILSERDRLLDYWLEVEKVAMHFNDLIIRLRLQGLTAIGAILTFAAILARFTTAPVPIFVFILVPLFLALVWFAIYLLDTKYYMKLLYGSVKELHSIEDKLTTYGIDVAMSGRIELVLENIECTTEYPIEKGFGKTKFGNNAVKVANIYYFITLLPLLCIPFIVVVVHLATIQWDISAIDLFRPLSQMANEVKDL